MDADPHRLQGMRHSRHRLQAQARLLGARGTCSGRVLDLSMSGMRVAAPAPSARGERVRVDISGHGVAVEGLAATVIRADGGSVALSFVGLDAAVQQALERLLEASEVLIDGLDDGD